jgi:hypothetical protein
LLFFSLPLRPVRLDYPPEPVAAVLAFFRGIHFSGREVSFALFATFFVATDLAYHKNRGKLRGRRLAAIPSIAAHQLIPPATVTKRFIVRKPSAHTRGQ